MTTGGGDMYKATQPNLGSPENFTYLLYKPPPNLQVSSKTSFDFFIVYNVSLKHKTCYCTDVALRWQKRNA